MAESENAPTPNNILGDAIVDLQAYIKMLDEARTIKIPASMRHVADEWHCSLSNVLDRILEARSLL